MGVLPSCLIMRRKRTKSNSGTVMTRNADNASSHHHLNRASTHLTSSSSYRVFTSEEFAALASAAAFTTAALTQRAKSSDQNGEQQQEQAALPTSTMTNAGDASDASDDAQHNKWAPLEPHQQEQIAAQLRAWAGLEGPERQEEARKALEERKVQLLEAHNGTVDAHAGGKPGDDKHSKKSTLHSIENVPASAFFPPDFASHFQAQLQALAEGYYERVHKEDLVKSHFATSEAANGATAATTSIGVSHDPERILQNESGVRSAAAASSSRKRPAPSRSGSRTPVQTDAAYSQQEAPQQMQQPQQHHRQQHQEQNEHVLRNAVVKQDDGRYGMPGPAYGTSNQVAQLPPEQDPMHLIAAASGAAGVDVRSPQIRDQLLQFAHNLYSTGSTTVPAPSDNEAKPGATATVTQLHPTLLPLLHTLHGLHPEHLPTLLLLSCAYYTAGDLPGSLWYNNLILRLDPQYVEAMSNIGTTLRALGRWREAESWWWRAIKLRPGYWDAYENLLGVLCSPRQEELAANAAPHPSLNGAVNHDNTSNALPSFNLGAIEPKAVLSGPRFAEALQLCEFVELHVTGSVADEQNPERRMSKSQLKYCPITLPAAQVPRLQNLYYGKGNLRYVLPEDGSVPAAKEYEHAIEVVISPHPQVVYSTRDLIIATCVVSVLSLGVEIPGLPGGNAAFKIARALGLDLSDRTQASLVATGAYSSLFRGGILALVRRAGDDLVRLLLQLGGGHLPMLLLLPAPALQVTRIVFADTNGILPSLALQVPGKRPSEPNLLTSAVQQANNTTSTVLLTLAKLFQDATASPAAGPHGPLTLGGIPPSISLLLPLYYISLALNPSASTCNNLGILLSSIPTVATVLDTSGRPQQVNGQSLAMQYYSHGLHLDSRHPHLYTNLGSLLKDLGHLNEAIKMYEKAIECNP